ncbi:MAG: succinate dehydrogenase cytochrome b subunit [Bacteroidetes bacterium]|jgi:succinate dehydrogenase / fumarate reductase cytochrome b subunit|nr:succinate dehydrogenase cytochrome b subunit [Bacteroidota bacterium]MBP7255550.1 succinate dehydrogenase cytochrome b subunit [Chitinophagales bacterium]MBK7641311.1 succinate dehydrogenase cytochrome b subunit [Bacteroidota bacterium]MBK8673556.1 succinate dehydrogenase cytochrome b subunit [Bacteroidota bacterium]MBK9354196.1 succinate dehydrogenase cytochrome b subunit [Bacteroidota bacterium]
MAKYNLTTIFKSSIGKKIVMGLTGLFLISFLLVHCGINACIFLNDNGETFNKAAHFMGTNLFIRTAEIGLFLGLLIHIIQGLVLTYENNKKRPIKYAVNAGNQNSKWYSRSMGLLGTLLLIFLIIHMGDFWTHSRVPGLVGGLPEVEYDGVVYHDLYAKMVEEFKEVFVVILYVISMFSLGFHLLHGFSSAFQSLGINHSKYNPMIKSVGFGFSIIIPLLFALMPLSIYFGLIK